MRTVMTPEQRASARRLACQKYRENNREKRREQVRRSAAKNKEKKRAYNAEWWKKNREKAALYRKDWDEKNPDKLRELQRENRKRNADKIRLRNRSYVAKNKDKAKKWRKNFMEKHREKYLGYFKRIHRENPERSVNAKAKRRARIGEDRLSRGLKNLLLAAQNGLCKRCSEPFGDETPHMDHIEPLSRGGRNVDENMQLLCGCCNRKKSNLLPHEEQPVTLPLDSPSAS